jgi:hypothetical protein
MSLILDVGFGLLEDFFVDMLGLQPPELGIDCTSVPEFYKLHPRNLEN